MQIGQAAGAIAAIAALEGISPSEVDVRRVQNVILAGGGYVMPFLDVDKADARFKPYQRIGASGILQGEGRNVGWSNQTWLRADDPLLYSELTDFIDFYDSKDKIHDFKEPDRTVDLQDAVLYISAVRNDEFDANAILESYGLSRKEPFEAITRGEFALLVDSILDPFGSRAVDIHGNFKN